MSDDSSSIIVLAGPGLLRYNNTLSVNPVQKLRSVTIRDKLTIPEPNDASDATTKSYVDTSLLNSTLKAGHGLKIDPDLTISIRNNQTLKSIIITEPPINNGNVVTKSYVDNIVGSLPTKNYVDTAVNGLISRRDVELLIEPTATRNYVQSFIELIPTRDELKSSIINLVSKEELKNAVVNLSSIPYVNDVVSNYLKKEDISTFSTKSYVDSTITNKIQDLASVTFVKSNIEPLAEKIYVDEKLTNLSSTEYVDAKTLDLLEQSKSYVNSALLDVSRTQFTIQYVVPTEDDTILYEGKNVLLLNGRGVLNKLTIEMPDSPKNGQIVRISTARDINNLRLSKFDTIGDITDPDVLTLTTGSSLQFVYSSDAKGWFLL